MEVALSTADSLQFCMTGWGMWLQGLGQGARSSLSFMVVAKEWHRAKFYLWNCVKCNQETCFAQNSEPWVVLLPLAWTTRCFPPAGAVTQPGLSSSSLPAASQQLPACSCSSGVGVWVGTLLLTHLTAPCFLHIQPAATGNSSCAGKHPSLWASEKTNPSINPVKAEGLFRLLYSIARAVRRLLHPKFLSRWNEKIQSSI